VKRLAIAAAAGLLFGVGLVLSGMTDPRNVIAFLDVTGAWNPVLLVVMASAIAVHATLLRLVPGGPAFTPSLSLRGVDRPLVAGAAIFGVGWGLSGYCPGPAVVALGFGSGRAFAFVAALLAGSAITELVLSRLSENGASVARSQSPTPS
jgi:uncharacterized membrane protein YedE/YeeE